MVGLRSSAPASHRPVPGHREPVLRHPQGPPSPSALPQMKTSLRSLDEHLEGPRLMASLDAGSLHPELSEFSMQPLMDRLDLAFGPVAVGKGLRWDVTPSVARVRSNPAPLKQMLAHLVGNAVRFTALGGVVLSRRFSGPHLLPQVRDTGLGIDPRHQPHVFECPWPGARLVACHCLQKPGTELRASARRWAGGD